jgi:UDP-N-acetylmuramoyl-tripeptide--D-alanyl-D-alanine ligase
MIDLLSFSSLENELSATLYGVDVSFNQLSTDTRSVSEGDVYLALKGDKFDGHDFIESAVAQGCAGVVGERDFADLTCNVASYLKVDNTEEALASLAKINRKKFKGKLIGLTGSAGKTSTKNMLSTILSEFGETLATKGNFNNEIGVPLTLLNISAAHDYSVVEMGARNKGDIAYLSDIALPDIAMVLNAGSAHIEIFGSYEAIVETKGEIYDSLSADGIGVLNFDDPAFETWRERLGDRQGLSFSSESENADVFATDIKCKSDGSSFTLNYGEESLHVDLPMPGLHQVQNALAAATSAIAAGCDLPGIVKGLEKVASSEGRMTVSKLGGMSVLDDTYNANPVSMKAALNVLAMQEGYRIAVLGEMAELGPYASDAHMDVALHLAETGIEEVCLIGPFAQLMSEYIGERATVFDCKRSLAEHLLNSQKENKVIMIKGSRSAAMDEIVSLIKRRVH